jgi:hypothetical protein
MDSLTVCLLLVLSWGLGFVTAVHWGNNQFKK